MTTQTEHLGMAPARPCMTELVQEQAAEIARLRELCRRAYDVMRRTDDDDPVGRLAGDMALMAELANAAGSV